MRGITLIFFILAPVFIMTSTGCITKNFNKKIENNTEQEWKIHAMNRPLPQVVKPGPAGIPGQPPSDALVLFNGKDLSQWCDSKGKPARWKVEQDYMEVVKKTGSLKTKQNFGDCRLHIEWAAPLPVSGKGQERGNSGVFLMDKYEVQVLDSYNNRTYADGMAAAVYGQFPPLANACRPPGEWQAFDIIFHRPHFDKNENLIHPARMTVLHNGVLVQDNVELLGPTAWKKRVPYKLHPEKMPLSLQDHGNPVRYRNIWIRELK